MLACLILLGSAASVATAAEAATTTATHDGKDSSTADSVPGWLIAILVVYGIISALLLAFAIWYLWTRCRGKGYDIANGEELRTAHAGRRASQNPPTLAAPRWHRYPQHQAQQSHPSYHTQQHQQPQQHYQPHQPRGYAPRIQPPHYTSTIPGPAPPERTGGGWGGGDF